MLPRDPLANVLYVDLSRKRSWVERREDLFEKYLGGTGVAVQLLAENCPPGMDPLAPEAPVVLATGPLDGLFPLGSKTVAMFKSPHTGNLGESHAGGRSAVGRSAQTKGGAAACRLTPRSNQAPPRRASSLTGMASSTSLPTTTPRMASGKASAQRTRSPNGARRCCCRPRSAPDTSTMV